MSRGAQGAVRKGETWGVAWGCAGELAGGSADCRVLFPPSLEGGGKRGLAKEELEPEIKSRERDLALGRKDGIVGGRVRKRELKRVETKRCGGKDH